MSGQMAPHTIHNLTDVILVNMGCEDACAMIAVFAEDMRLEDKRSDAEGNLCYSKQDLDLVKGCQDTDAEAAGPFEVTRWFRPGTWL